MSVFIHLPLKQYARYLSWITCHCFHWFQQKIKADSSSFPIKSVRGNKNDFWEAGWRVILLSRESRPIWQGQTNTVTGAWPGLRKTTCERAGMHCSSALWVCVRWGKERRPPESQDAVRLEEVKGWGGGGGSSSAAFGNQGASPWVACESPPPHFTAAAKPNPSTLGWDVTFSKTSCLKDKHTNDQSVYMWITHFCAQRRTISAKCFGNDNSFGEHTDLLSWQLFESNKV